METAYTFDDVMFLPRFSNIRSRSEIDLTTTLGKVRLPLPIISANMADITEENMAVSMHINGGMGILHRFMSIEDNVKMYRSAWRCLSDGGEDLFREHVREDNSGHYAVGVSVGV